ncbi:MAG: hypothetical protein JWL84_126 [Rhodospirillales bacterium]|nr:hypothetical protein [Rhodospirillales bacterium]
MSRAAWKIYWRQLRIIRRESAKAMTDCVLFGTGVVECGPDVPDFVRHVPVEKVVLSPPQNKWFTLR